MNQFSHLAEQHILESEARLRHIDEWIAKGRASSARDAKAAAEADPLLARIQADRDRLAGELDALRRQPRGDATDVARAEGLRGVLETVGRELEAAMGAIFERGGR
jgi:hypothetical protein